jgi:RNA polymerase sigma-70 factor (ECF subfamily)
MRRAGPYQLQAAIAACHATAPDVAATDWVQIANRYADLARLTPSPVVELNRAIAVAMADGIPAGLALVDALAAAGSLDGYHLLPATRADLLRRAGRVAEARVSYAQALELATTEADRRYLSGRLRELAPET